MALLPWPARQNPLRTGHFVRFFTRKAPLADRDMAVTDGIAARFIPAFGEGNMSPFELNPSGGSPTRARIAMKRKFCMPFLAGA